MVERAVALVRFVREGVAACFKLKPLEYLEFLILCLEDLHGEITDVRKEVREVEP